MVSTELPNSGTIKAVETKGQADIIGVDGQPNRKVDDATMVPAMDIKDGSCAACGISIAGMAHISDPQTGLNYCCMEHMMHYVP